MNFFLVFSPPPPPPITFLMVRPLHNPIIHLCYLPKLLHNNCLQFLLGHENVPREVENDACEDFFFLLGVGGGGGEGEEVYYGICAISEL